MAKVIIVGELYFTDYSVGGGPIYPPPQQPQPPGIWPGGRPEHPIYWPPSVWPDPGHPAHPIAPGGPPPSVWPGPEYPAHPIAPGGPPPGIWPSPGYPAHPIAPGGPPPSIWPSPGRPAHPIVLPPDQPPTEAPPPIDESWKWAWSPSQGWHPAYVPEGGKPKPPPVEGETPPPA